MAQSLILVVAFVVFLSTGDSASVIFKDGRCPVVEESDLNCIRKFVSNCYTDFDCNGTAKCCRTACHQYQCIEHFSTKKRLCQNFGDIVFVLDASGSIGKEQFEKSKSMIKKIVKAFPQEKGHKHAAIVYGKTPSIEFDSITSEAKTLKTNDILKRIDRIVYRKSAMTRINFALKLMQKEIFTNRKELQRTKMLLLFTDGKQNFPPYKAGLAKIGKTLYKSNVKVFGILSGSKFDINAILKLCPNDNLVFNQEFLPEIIATMSSEMEHSC